MAKVVYTYPSVKICRSSNKTIYNSRALNRKGKKKQKEKNWDI